MQNDHQKEGEEAKVLKVHEIQGFDGQIISFGDTKTIEKNGDLVDVTVFIPQCCREGWPSCPHVIKKHRIAKRNVGL